MHRYDVSVILPFRDSEEIIGTAVSQLARHLREQKLSFEILAIDDDSGDNCQSLLALIRNSFPELRVMHAPARGRGPEVGAQRAQGRALWFIEPEAAVGPLGWFSRTYQRIVAGERDLIVLDERVAVAHRTRCLPALAAARRSSRPFLQQLARRALQRRLAVETPGTSRRADTGSRWATSFLGALSPFSFITRN